MKAKKISTTIMMVIFLVTLVSLASADFFIEEIRINGDVANDGDDLYVERGDDLSIRVILQANEEMRNAYLGAYLSGYRYSHYEPNMVMAHTPTFNLPAGNKRAFNLDVSVPMLMQQKDAKLRLVLFDENTDTIVTYNYQLSIYGSDEKAAIQIRNFFISPSEQIEAGRALSTKIQVRNFGNYDLDDVVVKLSIPELNVQTFETIDWLRKEETQSFESLLLRIPHDAKPGNYEVIAEVEYDNFQAVSQIKTIKVLESEETIEEGVDGRSIVTMPEKVQVVPSTQGSMYPILIENKGASSQTYSLSVSGHEAWATATFEPSSVFVVRGGQTQTAYLRIKAFDEEVSGDKLFTVKVASGDEVKTTTVMASIVSDKEETEEKTSLSARQVLEWALVVLIIALIVLGLIVVFKKMKKNNEDEDEQTYY